MGKIEHHWDDWLVIGARSLTSDVTMTQINGINTSAVLRKAHLLYVKL